ncbi:hypothetical protein [Stakelama marina]|uniref:Uncharacterized protein n=1 Tax=Stakelama marina TaxID=2826939 RepID=A0A8T4IIG0_9SPHN|nr:hypothetical protein [Stakelama marina]MBR0553822.1 hypothetical protein [Stakelama marina]
MLDLVALVAAATAVQPAAAAPFSPPLDRTLQLRISQTRSEDGRRKRFVVRRTVRFAREGDGFVAELVTIGADGANAGSAGSRFEAAMASLMGRTIRYHLDTRGRVRSIDELGVLWKSLTAAVAEEARKAHPERKGYAERIISSLGGLPVAQRQRMLATMLTSVIEVDAAERGVMPVKAVTLPAQPPFGQDQRLEGTERSWREGNRLVVSERFAGDLKIPDGSGAVAHIETDIVRRVDPLTGMLVRSRKTKRTTIGDETRSSVTEITLE